VNQHVCILRPNHLLNSEFLNYLIVSPKFKSALLFQGAGGATRQALTKAMIENFDIPMPTLNKQAEAIEKIKQLNDKTTQPKTEITAKIDLFNQLKASVLDGAFRGAL
jgi:restriction endonuclease S subunit